MTPVEQQLADTQFDVLVVGGGITGAGIARHAALAGLSTALVEAADFASGTSSRSSKLIHGGLRYLAMGDVALVREAARERKSVNLMVPHLAEPKWMLVPAASRLGLAKLRVGVGLYERLGQVDPSHRHESWDARSLTEREPLLDRTINPWACVYQEYLTDDTRLVLATLRDAAHHSAVLGNYLKVVSLNQSADGCVAAVQRTAPFAPAASGPLNIRARVVVNATGPWVESMLPAEGEPRLQLSKGVHLVFDRARLPVRQMLMLNAADGRPVFVIPRTATTYVGTTDTSYPTPDYWPQIDEQDVAYLLATLNEQLTIDPLNRSDILSSWSGLRPLIRQTGKAPREMSRRDEIWRDDRVFTIAGGKLTGFRKMAADAMAAVAERLGADVDADATLRPMRGALEVPYDAAVADLVASRCVSEAAAKRLVRVYGAEASAVVGERPSEIVDSFFFEEVDWAIDAEHAVTLADVIHRRLRIIPYRPQVLDVVSDRAGAYMAKRCGWSDERLASEREQVHAHILDGVSQPPA